MYLSLVVQLVRFTVVPLVCRTHFSATATILYTAALGFIKLLRCFMRSKASYLQLAVMLVSSRCSYVLIVLAKRSVVHSGQLMVPLSYLTMYPAMWYKMFCCRMVSRCSGIKESSVLSSMSLSTETGLQRLDQMNSNTAELQL